MDSRNIENEIMVVVWFDKNSQGCDERVITRTSYLKISRPSTAGIFDVLEAELQGLGILAVSREHCAKLVGISNDGASANAGLKGLVEKELPWLVWMWCMAHRLELAVKDALTFYLIDDMLLRLYFLYASSPKKCRELKEVVKECLSIKDGGTRPVRASGSRWISHKWNAMRRVLSKYGDTHIARLS